MPSNKIIQIVAAESSTPEKDAAFDKWYTGKHVPMLFKFKGVKQASRYKLKGDVPNCSKYLTIYEFENEANLAAFPKSPAFAEAIKDYENTHEAIGFTMKWAGVYELIKSWER
jgi:antibiotic biosynthesis monooxygenase (ABM) superfamily enzyme